MAPASTTTEPDAAALNFASTTRVAPGETIAVYDLGGGTFDAAVLRKTTDGFERLGSPEGVEHLGGIDFDEAVFGYVRRALGPGVAELDPTDPAVRAAVARLRQECVEAKEALSTDTETAIPVLLPALQTQIRLTRGQSRTSSDPHWRPQSRRCGGRCARPVSSLRTSARRCWPAARHASRSSPS